jgi:glycosyltransferase involved in cell wall biosynthesis
VALSLYRRRRDPRFAPAAIDTPASAVFLWLRYMLDLERHSRGMRRCFVPFRSLKAIASVSDLDTAAKHGGAVPSLDQDSWLAMARSVDALLGEGDLAASAGVFDAARQALDLALAVPSAPEGLPSPSGGTLGAARAFTRRPAGSSPSGPVIGFLSGEPESRGHIYRVENRISALIGEPAGVFRIDHGIQSPEDIAAACDLIIVFRRRMDIWLERLVSRAQAAGVPLVFDIDDLVFDPDLMVPDVFRFLEGKPPEFTDEWKARARGYRAALQAASHGWATTQALRREMLNVQPRVSVLKNGLSDHHLKHARKPEPRPAGRGLVIGYASGTPTHDHDFAGIAAPLAQLMQARPDFRLEIAGPVSAQALGPLSDLGARVSFLPLVDYFSLPRLMSRFDINLAPLEAGNRFCACKSELKFFEAGIVGVPTIASATPPFREAIRGGEDGLLAGSDAEWRACLETLAGDPRLRVSLGTGAARSALAGFGPEAQKRDFLALCQQLLPGFSPAPAGA